MAYSESFESRNFRWMKDESLLGEIGDNEENNFYHEVSEFDVSADDDLVPPSTPVSSLGNGPIIHLRYIPYLTRIFDNLPLSTLEVLQPIIYVIPQ